MLKPIICCPGSINPDLKLKTNVNKGVKTFFGNYFYDLGGKGCDTCCAIKNISEKSRKVYLVGCIGNDEWGKYALKKLKKKKIEIDFIFKKKEKTGIVLEYIFENGEVEVGIDSGANKLLTKEDVLKAKKIIESSALIIGQIENNLESLAISFKIAKQNNVPTYLDPSIVPKDEKNKKFLFTEIMPLTDIITPDRYELYELTDIKPKNKKSLIKAVKKLLKYSKIVCVTLGSKGVFLSDKKGYSIIPSFKVKAVDGGGAGDTFRGVFGYKIVKYCEQNNCEIDKIPFKNLKEFTRYANAAAAIEISKYGTIETIPTKKEIEEFLK